MASQTPRFGLFTYSTGEAWDHTDAIEAVDELVIARGAVSNRPASGDYDNELYLATDEGIMYRWDDSGSSWVAAVEGLTSPLASDLDANNFDLTNVGNLGSANGFASLNSNGVLPSGQVPALAITEVSTVADQTARLALDVEEGDVAIQTDNSTTYIFTGGDSTMDANWSEIEFDAVTAIDGETITPDVVDTLSIENQDYNESVTTANTGTSYAIDLSTANMFELTLTGDVTFSITSTGSAGNSFVVYLEQDGTGGRTITWPASVEWPDGSAPSAPSDTGNLELSFVSPDGGTTWRGRESGRDFS